MYALFSVLDYIDYNTRVISDLVEHPFVLYHRRYVNKLVDKLKSFPEKRFGRWYSGIELFVLFRGMGHRVNACPVQLVYEYNSLATNTKLLKAMKRKCPELKLVLILTNLVGSTGSPRFSLSEQREIFDLIVTFSEDDAKRFGLSYYEGMYSRIELEGLRKKDESYEYDLYFCGRDKGRASILASVADTLDRHSSTYRFDIIGDVESRRSGFFYQSELIPNEEMLRRASKAKTVLEVMADPCNKGSSLRPYEAYALGAKLLSNNRFLSEKPWFNPRQISIFEDAKQIDVDFIRNPLEPKDAQDVEALSPVRFLEFVAVELGLQFGK